VPLLTARLNRQLIPTGRIRRKLSWMAIASWGWGAVVVERGGRWCLASAVGDVDEPAAPSVVDDVGSWLSAWRTTRVCRCPMRTPRQSPVGRGLVADSRHEFRARRRRVRGAMPWPVATAAPKPIATASSPARHMWSLSS